MTIRPATPADSAAIDRVHREAFGGDSEAGLVRDMLADARDAPVVSLLAETAEGVAGHVLFTAARLDPPAGVAAALLAPLAVRPDRQRRGVGTSLVAAGLDRLKREGVGLVFVLGDPGYYRRFGFEPAVPLRLVPPYALPEEHLEAWQVRTLGLNIRNVAAGTLRCCAALDRPEIWQG